MEELEKNIYELRGVAGIIRNLDSHSSSDNAYENMLYVLSSKINEIADNLESMDEK